MLDERAREQIKVGDVETSKGIAVGRGAMSLVVEGGLEGNVFFGDPKESEIARIDPLSVFPLEMIESPDHLMDRLFPDRTDVILQDRAVEYILRDTEQLEKLFLEHGRVLINGRSKSGKTREAAELLIRRWHLRFCLLVLRRREKLENLPPIPDAIPYRNLVVLVDDVDHHCKEKPQQDSSASEPASSGQDFLNQLSNLIGRLEEHCGDPQEVRVLMTVRHEPQFFKQILFDQGHPLWKDFALYNLEDVSTETAVTLIKQLAQDTSMELASGICRALAEKNGGTFLNLILAFDDWKRQGISTVGQEQLEDFEGELAITWERRYRAAVDHDPEAQYLYAAIDTALRADLIPHAELVVDIAARLERKTTLLPMNRIQLGIRHIWETLAMPAQRSGVWRRILWQIIKKIPWREAPPALRGPWQKISSALQPIGTIWKWLACAGGYETGRYSLAIPIWRERRLRDSLEQLMLSEIPNFEDVLHPYDGQVDGKGDAWSNAGIVAQLLTQGKVANGDMFFAHRLIALARSLRQERYVKGSLLLLEKAVRLAPNVARAWNNLGIVLERLGRDEDALAAYDQAVRLDPTYIWAVANRAYPLEILGRLNEALETLDKALEIAKGYGRAYGIRGEILRRIGDYEGALHALEQAVAADPGRSWHYWEWGLAAIAAGKDYREIIKTHEQVMAVIPRNGALCVNLASLLCILGQYERAKEFVEKVLELKPADLYTSAHRIALAEREKNDSLAEQLLQDVLSKNSEEAWAYACLGWAFCRVGLFQRAVEMHRHALEMGSLDGFSILNYSLSLLCNGQKQEALEYYRENVIPSGYVSMAESVFWLKMLGARHASPEDVQEAITLLQSAIAEQVQPPRIETDS